MGNSYVDKYGFDPVDVLSVDLNNLEKEVRDHATYMGKMIKIYKKKFIKWKELAFEFDKLEDKCAKRVRNDPEAYGIKKDHKLTDALVNRTIRRQFDELEDLKMEVNKAEAEKDEWNNYISAMRAKGQDMQIAYELWAKGYYDLNIRARKDRAERSN
jgi:hypothetical protein